MPLHCLARLSEVFLEDNNDILVRPWFWPSFNYARVEYSNVLSYSSGELVDSQNKPLATIIKNTNSRRPGPRNWAMFGRPRPKGNREGGRLAD